MGAEAFLPAPGQGLEALRRASADCRGCDLYRRATQTVFGAGEPHARVLLVGEQPGDKEDIEGEPFVGPAGRVLHQALEESGLVRTGLYVTNAVKHFKWEPRGKLRLHKQPSAREVAACRPWLLAEIEAVRPQFVVCLGAVAARSLLGPDFRVTRHRGETVPGPGEWVTVATVHPASILRVRDEAQRRQEYERFVADLSSVARRLAPVA